MTAALIALCGLLIAATGASAATVSVQTADECAGSLECKGGSFVRRNVVYAAAPGETNTVTLTGIGSRSGPDTVTTYDDTTAPMTPGAACAAVSATEVSCRPYDVPADEPSAPAFVSLGDLNDSLAVTSPFRYGLGVDGGPGDDTIDGGDGGSALIGGEGHDTIAAEAGDDILVASEDTAAPDSYDGGPGADSITYQGTRTNVTVRLGSPGSGGVHGEDRITNIENVGGGLGDDVIVGDSADNALDGDRGDDRIDGGAGNDTLDGGAGHNTLIGGPGDDDIEATADKISCGPGHDTIEEAQPDTVLGPDCETVTLDFQDGGGQMRAYPVSVHGGRAHFRVPCPASKGCRGFVRVRPLHARSGGRITRFRSTRRGAVSVFLALRHATRRTAVRIDVSDSFRDIDSDDYDDAQLAYAIRMP